MIKKCCINGCNNELGFIESTVNIKHCEECENLLMKANLRKIDISQCKSKEDLIKQLEKAQKK